VEVSREDEATELAILVALKFRTLQELDQVPLTNWIVRVQSFLEELARRANLAVARVLLLDVSMHVHQRVGSGLGAATSTWMAEPNASRMCKCFENELTCFLDRKPMELAAIEHAREIERIVRANLPGLTVNLLAR
jgi:hypothetical protein